MSVKTHTLDKGDKIMHAASGTICVIQDVGDNHVTFAREDGQRFANGVTTAWMSNPANWFRIGTWKVVRDAGR